MRAITSVTSHPDPMQPPSELDPPPKPPPQIIYVQTDIGQTTKRIASNVGNPLLILLLLFCVIPVMFGGSVVLIQWILR